MGTMLQAAGPTLDDFGGLEGCNEVLNVTRPDIVRAVHEAYFAAGSDCVETNTFGANATALGEYGISERIYEYSVSGARLAREVADGFAADGRPRFVIGSVGPGTKLPSLGHLPYATLRDAYTENVRGLVDGGADAVLVETCQDLLQVKAAVIGAKRAIAASGREVALIAQMTVETTGTMLLGSEIGAALAAIEPLGIDLIGMNCATGPAEMTEHLRYLSQHARVPVSVMPNAGLPILTADGAHYPLTPDELAEALGRFVNEYGVNFVGGCCGTTPGHIAAVVAALNETAPVRREPRIEPGLASLYHHVPFQQDASVLLVGERTNANGSKAFRDAMLAGDFNGCIEIAREQARDGSHLLDLCVDYVGRDGAADMRELAGRFATASTLPIMLDSTEPAVLEAGLEMLGGRSIINSVNFEDGDGPNSRYMRVMPVVREHGAAVVALTIDEEGQARTREWKVRVADRLIDDLTGRWGLRIQDIFIDALTFPIATGQEETRRDGIETIEAIREIAARHPGVNFTLGVSNISFGLNPAARQVLNSVFLHECTQAGLTSAIVHASKILPMARIPEEQRQVALDLVYDRRVFRADGTVEYDPLQKYIDLFEGVDAASARASRAEELLALPLDERLQRRIVDGERNGLEADLDLALESRGALEIVNDTLLEGMKTVGDLFGSGQMQLPFVLQSAEVMKIAVAYLEPHMEKADAAGKGTIVLATVRGDVHDIGKNLVDIILSNNGYTVVNLGIKQPINAILDAAEEHSADVIGMSGLLVKSTVIMKENLAEMLARGMASRWPVLLGGAALTRSYVEDDLRSLFDGGQVHYARDAFEGLALMDRVMTAKKTGVAVLDPVREAALAARRERREKHRAVVTAELPGLDDASVRSDVATDAEVPQPPFFGTRVVKGIPTGDYVSMLDERALFLGQWGLRGARAGQGPSYEELVETEGRPRLRYWLDRFATEQVLEAAVVYGYFPCYSSGNDLVLPEQGVTFTFPRQRQERRLCLSDFFRTQAAGPDVVGLQLVTVGHTISEYANKLFAQNAYRDYLEVHGLSVQLTEALAEYWHARVRSELSLPSGGSVGSADPGDLAGILHNDYRGCRYAFGYPACPDLEDRAKIVWLLDAGRIGVELSEEYQLHPEQATDAIIVHHPEANYYNAK